MLLRRVPQLPEGPGWQYEVKSKVRVAGPFTIESVSPHRVLAVDENDNVIDGWKMSDQKNTAAFAGTPDFAAVILENLKLAGVQQAHKEDRVSFTSLTGLYATT